MESIHLVSKIAFNNKRDVFIGFLAKRKIKIE